MRPEIDPDPNGPNWAVIHYDADQQQPAGRDLVNTGIAVPGSADLLVNVMLGTSKEVDEVRVRGTCP